MLFVTVDPPDAEVLVDGKSLGAPEPSYVVFVEPGTHTVRARLAGYQEAASSAEAPKGSWPSVWLQLPKAAPAPAPRVSTANAGAPALASAPGATTPTSAESAAKLRRVGIIATAATMTLGAGFMISGAVLDGEVEKRAASLAQRADKWACRGDAHKEECAELHSLATTRDVLGNVGLGSFILGGVIGTLTVGSFLWSPKPKDEHTRTKTRAQIRVVPAATPKQAGAMITGTW
jgi:hypothetical protein